MKVFDACIAFMLLWDNRSVYEWVKVFRELVNTVEFEKIKRECFRVVDFLSGASQPIESKTCACEIYSILSSKVVGSEFDEAFTGNIKLLCNDFNWQIRKAMCLSLKEIINSYKACEYGKQLFALLISCLNDTEEEARVCSLHSFLSRIDIYYSNSQLHKEILAIIKKSLSTAGRKQAYVISRNIGNILLVI
jgi:hypothetical protein